MLRLNKNVFIGLLLISLIILIIEANQLVVLRLESEVVLKPLEIKGPTFAEVNETITFIVTSDGSPVEGAVVFFAGYEKETNENGIVTFQIDFAGPFKAVAQKKGHKTNSTLLWIFPKGSEWFLIRSTKSMTDPQLYGDFDSAGRMAGFNYARIKAYYTYDDKGNVYPIIITLGKGERLSDEATEAIKENYEGVVPRYNLWIRVPHEVYFKNLEWMISRARSWGLKIFLQAEVLPRVEEEHVEGVPPIALDDKAFDLFLDRRRSEALVLAEFAERHDVELLDPLGPFWFPEEPKDTPLRQLSLYRELLPKIRSLFHGKLAVWMIGRISDIIEGIGLKEYNYSGFDYLVPWFGCGGARLTTDSPYEWEDAVRKFLDFTEYLKEKYNVTILVGYIAGFEYAGENDRLFNKFMSYFNNSYEEARIWFMKLVLEEILRRSIRNADAHPLWFFEMQSSIPGLSANEEAYRKFSYWPSRRLLNLVSEYFSQPWNDVGRNALNILRHAEIIANSIIAKSYNVNLVDWIHKTLKRSSKAYEARIYEVAINEAEKILGFSYNLKNPLSISIDGRADDWKFIDPVYFNPSQAFPWFNLVFCYGKEKVKNMGNLKAVYTVNDRENIYLMLEFYGPPPQWIPNIEVDISGVWSHREGSEFHIEFAEKDALLFLSMYEDLEWDPRGRGDWNLIGKLEYARSEVVELKIPLKLIQNPDKFNLIVWYPWSAPWGDMEINVINWSALAPARWLLMSTSVNKTSIGKPINISGFIYPAHSHATVALTYTMPNGTTLTRNVATRTFGEFEDVFIPYLAGEWFVRASWSGDLGYEEAESQEILFIVLKANSSILLSVSDEKVRENEQIVVYGSINPPRANIAIILTFEKPDGTIFSKNISTNSDGYFRYTLKPGDVGGWKVYANCPGDDNYEGAISPPIFFMVEKPPSPIPPLTISITSLQPTSTPQKTPIVLVTTLVILAGIAAIILTWRRRGRARYT